MIRHEDAAEKSRIYAFHGRYENDYEGVEDGATAPYGRRKES